MITESFGESRIFMGGRGVWNRKTRVDETRSIDILDLQHKGVFTKGSAWSWTSSWSRNGEVVASISLRVESGDNGPTGLRFMYTITVNNTGEKKDYSYIIPVVSTRCNYGGQRWWFICPLVVDGQACQRRCRIVYMSAGAGYFGCRECHRLTYESRQRHRDKFYEGFEKPFRVAKAANEKLTKAQSWPKREKVLRKLFHALAAIENFDSILTSRNRKMIYKEK